MAFVPSLRILAGRPDPADALHFTVAYEFLDHTYDAEWNLSGRVWRPGMLHGYLRDDDSVEWRREGDGGPWGRVVPDLASAPTP